MIYNKHFCEAKKDETIKRLNDLAAIAKELNITQGQLALAWTVKYDNTTTMLLGASSVAQLETNLSALEHAKLLTPEILARIETVLGNRPVAELDYTTFTPRNRR
jgi:aryl-alcohol dehydrogenase-like predicted oxidoreductase